MGFFWSPVQAFLTCVVWLSAALSCHGATLPGREKRIIPSLTISSATKVTLMRTVAPGGRLPTLMVNTSCSEHKRSYQNQREERFWVNLVLEVKFLMIFSLKGLRDSQLDLFYCMSWIRSYIFMLKQLQIPWSAILQGASWCSNTNNKERTTPFTGRFHQVCLRLRDWERWF